MKRNKIGKHLVRVFETPSSEYSEWFGYYNYDPLSSDHTKLLCGRSSVDGVAPSKGMTIELGYYDIPSGIWHKIGKSDSWNWQQGAMLQWLPAEGGETSVVYNTSRNNRLVSVIYDINTGEEKEIDWPVYGITPDGRKSISLDLERSYWCRAYHYQSVVNPEKEGRIYGDDGIFEIDLTRNTRKRILSIQSIVECDASPDFSSKKHWLEHVMISPSGKRICFLHRFSSMDNVMDYGTRLCIADADGGNLQVIPGWNRFVWSHFGWNDDDSFSIYTVEDSLGKGLRGIKELLRTRPFPLSQLVKRIFYSSSVRLPYPLNRILTGRLCCYQYYSLDNDGRFSLSDRFIDRYLSIDGHPSFIHGKDVMLTDSYPDRNGYQRLLLYDIHKDRVTMLGEFYAALRNTPASCDLHPKLSGEGFVTVDTAYDGRHHMIVFRIANAL